MRFPYLGTECPWQVNLIGLMLLLVVGVIIWRFRRFGFWVDRDSGGGRRMPSDNDMDSPSGEKEENIFVKAITR